MQKFWIHVTILIIVSIPALMEFGHGADFQTRPEIERYAVSHYFRLEERMIWKSRGDNDFD